MPSQCINGIDIFYQDDDFSDPWKPHDTVFIQHGFGRNGNMFFGWVPWLARDFRVIRMDFRGMGRSGDPGPDYRFSVGDFLADFTGLLDALKIDRVHYIGESLGGVIGAAAAGTHPNRFKSLTLISTMVQVGRESTVAMSSFGYPTWADALRSLGNKAWWYKLRSATGELTGDAAEDEWFANEFARTPVHVTCALSEFAPTASVEPLLGNISAPTLLLTPGSSFHTPREQQDLMLRKIPDARQKIYHDGKHSDYYLRPDLLAQDTLEFIRSVNAKQKG